MLRPPLVPIFVPSQQRQESPPETGKPLKHQKRVAFNAEGSFSSVVPTDFVALKMADKHETKPRTAKKSKYSETMLVGGPSGWDKFTLKLFSVNFDVNKYTPLKTVIKDEKWWDEFKSDTGEYGAKSHKYAKRTFPSRSDVDPGLRELIEASNSLSSEEVKTLRDNDELREELDGHILQDIFLHLSKLVITDSQESQNLAAFKRRKLKDTDTSTGSTPATVLLYLLYLHRLPPPRPYQTSPPWNVPPRQLTIHVDFHQLFKRHRPKEIPRSEITPQTPRLRN